MRGIGCGDCVVTVLLGGPPFGVELDEVEERALETVLEWLSGPRLMALAVEAVELYIWDRAGSDN